LAATSQIDVWVGWRFLAASSPGFRDPSILGSAVCIDTFSTIRVLAHSGVTFLAASSQGFCAPSILGIAVCVDTLKAFHAVRAHSSVTFLACSVHHFVACLALCAKSCVDLAHLAISIITGVAAFILVCCFGACGAGAINAVICDILLARTTLICSQCAALCQGLTAPWTASSHWTISSWARPTTCSIIGVSPIACLACSVDHCVARLALCARPCRGIVASLAMQNCRPESIGSHRPFHLHLTKPHRRTTFLPLA